MRCIYEASVETAIPRLLAMLRGKVDLVLVDVIMPEVNGVDLVRSIRKLDDGSLPILIFSGTITSAEEVKELVEKQFESVSTPVSEPR